MGPLARISVWTLVGLAIAGSAFSALPMLTPKALVLPDMAAMKAEFARPSELNSAHNLSAQEQLGKRLFFESHLSGSGRMSCASCHDPDKGWSDGKALAIGDTNHVLLRRTPTLLDVAWGGPYFWDGRAATLEEQAKGPMGSPLEMNFSPHRVVTALNSDPTYRRQFDAAFPGEQLKFATVVKAIAAFERTIVSGKSAFDLWVEGDEGAITSEAKRGFVIFNTKANCAACHSSWRFTDDGFHDIGLTSKDEGRAAIAPGPVVLRYAMKTPTLRNVARRGPYMHDGSIKTLEGVIDEYNTGGLSRPSLSPDVHPLGLNPDEKKALLAFLKTLNDQHGSSKAEQTQ
jgi:cytochrome c peroxidase